MRAVTVIRDPAMMLASAAGSLLRKVVFSLSLAVQIRLTAESEAFLYTAFQVHGIPKRSTYQQPKTPLHPPR